MKKSSLIINIVLAVAIAVIYVLYFFGGKSGNKSNTSGKANGESSDLKIAYVKVDSLIVNYEFAQELHEAFVTKQEAYAKEYGQKRTRFEEQAIAFQEKAQRGGFLTQERAMQERDRLVNEEQQIGKLDQELSAKLSQLQAENNKQLLDSLMIYIKAYNVDKNYNYILNSGEILVGDETANITKSVLAGLNARYRSFKK